MQVTAGCAQSGAAAQPLHSSTAGTESPAADPLHSRPLGLLQVPQCHYCLVLSFKTWPEMLGVNLKGVTDS